MENFCNVFQRKKKAKWNLQKCNISSRIRGFSENDDRHITAKSIEYINREEYQIYTVEPSIKLNNSENYINDHNTDNEISPKLLPQVIAVLACSLIQLGIGVILGFPGVILPALTNANSTDIYLNANEVALFTSLPNVGIVFGALSSGVLMTWIGQRVVLLIVLPIGACGWIIMAYSYTFFWLIVSRVLSGIYIGSCTVGIFNYVAEISHPTVRGRLAAAIGFTGQMGVNFIYVLGSTSLNWRTVGLVSGLTPFMPSFLILYLLPNSPRWLATVNRKDEARASLKFFRGSAYNVEKELQDIYSQVIVQTNNNSIKTFKEKSTIKRLITLSLLMLFIQFTGNLVIMSYSVLIFNATNTDVDGYMSTIISGFMRMFGGLTYFIIADKFTRKSLIVIPLIISGLSIGSLGLYFYFMLHYDVQSFYWMPSTTIVIYLYSTGIYIPVFMLIRIELLPTSIRSIAAGFLTVLLSIGTFLSIFLYPYMVENIGYQFTFWFYGLICIFTALIVLFLIPETKGKTLEDIERIK